MITLKLETMNYEPFVTEFMETTHGRAEIEIINTAEEIIPFR